MHFLLSNSVVTINCVVLCYCVLFLNFGGKVNVKLDVDSCWFDSLMKLKSCKSLMCECVKNKTFKEKKLEVKKKQKEKCDKPKNYSEIATNPNK